MPEALVHRVIVRESKYRPQLVGRGGTIGLMQIKLATARGVGYSGDADGPARSRHQPHLWRKISRRRLARRQWRRTTAPCAIMPSGYYYAAKAAAAGADEAGRAAARECTAARGGEAESGCA